MTNNMIILKESVELMKQGVLEGTGKKIALQLADKSIVTVEMPEPIHTFAMWKELGYKVKKGEHAVASFTIWKHKKNVKIDEETGDEIDTSKMFMKQAHFFKTSQVERA